MKKKFIIMTSIFLFFCFTETKAKEIVSIYKIDYSFIVFEINDIHVSVDTVESVDFLYNFKKANLTHYLPDKMTTDSSKAKVICDTVGKKRYDKRTKDSVSSNEAEGLLICLFYNNKGKIERYIFSPGIGMSTFNLDCFYDYDDLNRIKQITNIEIFGEVISVTYYSNGKIRKINIYERDNKISKTFIFKYKEL